MMKSTLKVSSRILTTYCLLFTALLFILSCRTTKTTGTKPQQKEQPKTSKINYDYTVRGTIEGKYPINNAIIFTQDHKLVGIAPVRNNQFSFSGMHVQRDSNKFSPAYYVLCTERDSFEHGDQGISRLIYLDPEVNVRFHSGTLKYQVEGGPMNSLENEFLKHSRYFKKEEDSLRKALIAHTKLTGGDTTSEKVKEMLTVFHFRHLSQRDSAFLTLIRSNPASMVSLDHYTNIVKFPLSAKLSVTSQRKIFNQLSPDLKGSHLANAINTAIISKEVSEKPNPKYPYKIPVGGKMYNFTLPDIRNSRINTKKVFASNKYTLIEFWTSYCVPCLKEVPNMLEAKRMYRDKGFEIIMVSSDTKEDFGRLKGIISTYKMDSLIQLIDVTAKSLKALDIKATPANYLVNSNGKVVASNLRGGALVKKLEELLR
jgi:thiol-disulfide isomerase/thioredoxin